MERGSVLHKNGAGIPAVNTQSNDQNLLIFIQMFFMPHPSHLFFGLVTLIMSCILCLVLITSRQ